METQRKYDLTLLKYLRQQPSVFVGEKSHAIDLAEAQKARAFFAETNLGELALASFMRDQYTIGIVVLKEDFDLSAFTVVQIEMALNYRCQMRASRDGARFYLLLTDSVPRSGGREMDMFVSTHFHFDYLFYRALTGCCLIYLFIGLLLLIEKSQGTFLDYIFFAGTSILLLFGALYGVKYYMENRYLTTGFQPLVVYKGVNKL